MNLLSLLTTFISCAYISEDDVNIRLDPDQDGLIWKEDCEENNSALSEPLYWYLDADQDGYGDPQTELLACQQPEGYLSNNNDCNDDPDNNGALFNPEATEICDSIDNNCNGLIDDEDSTLSNNNYWFVDNDGDGEGSSENYILSCFPQDGWVQNSDDCNDNNANVSTASTEICDDLDNDCDAEVDEGLLLSFYLDADADGYGNAEFPILLCESQAGFSDNNEDCDDSNPTISPQAEEICDYIDNNCDSEIDEHVSSTYYQDFDGDGYGNPIVALELCEWQEGVSGNDYDCDDLDPQINPAQEEFCDGFDNNCDGQNDEGLSDQYLDADEDGYGDPQQSSGSCFEIEGFVPNSGDCDDSNANIHPFKGDSVDDSIDEDCDGLSCEAIQFGSAYFAVCEVDFWSQASPICESAGYSFGSIQNQTENDIVRGLVLSAAELTNIETVWIGYTDLNQEGFWLWEDGYAGTYTDWMQDEPNNNNSNEHCAVLDASSHIDDGTWNDLNCLQPNHSALCVYRSTTTLSP
ncbi:MAG: hypothetical protein CMK59_07605 [Proteobacteria bacterium]|nr:hypothetical protein [Pseudomonadota bacterium]